MIRKPHDISSGIGNPQTVPMLSANYPESGRCSWFGRRLCVEIKHDRVWLQGGDLALEPPWFRRWRVGTWKQCPYETGLFYLYTNSTLEMIPELRFHACPTVPYLFFVCLYVKFFLVLHQPSQQCRFMSLLDADCPAKYMVGRQTYGANSPSLCPTISSVMVTSM